MNNNITLIPDIRFPEFENDGEWMEKKLGNYIDLFSGIALKSEELTENDSGIPILRGINITEGYIRHTKDIDKYFLGSLENLDKYVVKVNDIVIGMDGSKVGKNVAMITQEDEGSILIQRVARIRTNAEADVNFVYQYFISDKFRSYVDTVNTSSGIPHISAHQIKDYIVGFPSKIQEQQKIASCLSTLDNLISAHSQKLELLKSHKKGLMQNLFPIDNGELTIDNFRTKLTFSDVDEGWVTTRLGDVVSFKVTNSFSRDKMNYKSGNVKNIHYGDIHTKFQTLFDIEKENVPFINPNIDIQKIKEDSYCQEGDLILADASEDLADVGKSIEIINLNNKELVSGLHTILARPNKGLFPKGFIGYLFKSDFIRKQIQKESQGTKVLSISATRLQNLIIHYPLSIIHSNKIASCLSAVDELITAQGEKIEQLKQHKKGLMQGLFPKSITN